MNSLYINFQEGDLPSLHPHSLVIYLRGISISKNLYECLTRIDNQGKPQLAGAKSVDISPDRLHYTFKLRENRWSDGSFVTAYQYENAWKEALSPSSNCSRADLLYMIKNAQQAKKGEVSLEAVGVKAIDEKTLVVDLAYPSPHFLELAAQVICAPLIDPKNPKPAAFNGPFMLDHWEHGQVIALKQNPYFWDNQKIALQQIDIYMVQDNMSAFGMYEKGELDWMGLPFIRLPQEVAMSLKSQQSLSAYPIDRTLWIFLNTQYRPLSSPSIRQALSLAIDRESLVKNVLASGIPLKKPLPVSLSPNIPSMAMHIEENIETAKRKFDAGLRELGLTRETFPAIEVTYSQQAGRKQFAEYLQQTWSKVFGINVKAVPQEWNVLRRNLESGEYQVSGCYEAAFYNDPLELMDKFTSQNPNNFSRWINADFQKKVLQARNEYDSERRIKLIAEAEKILLDQMPFIPVCSDEYLFTHNPKLSGYIFDYVGACDFSYASLKGAKESK